MPPTLPVIPEVRVYGPRLVTPPTHYFTAPNIPAGPGYSRYGGTALNLAGLALAAVPEVIPEVTIVGKRPPPNLRLVISNPAPGPPPSAFSKFLSRLALPATIANILGITAAKILDEIGMQQLEREYQEFLAISSPLRPDSPLRTVQPEVIPEVTVTATRAQQLRAALVVPPAPQFFPYEFPSALPVRVPGRVPARPPRRNPQRIKPPKRPQRRRRPERRERRSSQRPGARGLQVARPDLFPSIGPGSSLFQNLRRMNQQRLSAGVNALTGLSAANVGFSELPQSFADPSAQPRPETARRRCPPCKKDEKKDERRNQCYKKLIFEREYERWDRVIEWQEIDCTTGRPL